MDGVGSGKRIRASAGSTGVDHLAATDTARAAQRAAGPADRGDREAAFRRYVEPELVVLLRAARTLTGSWADAEDVVQDTLVRAWRAIDRFDGRHPRAWLLTIMRNTYRNSCRRSRPRLAPDDGWLERQRPAFGPGQSPDPEELHTDLELSAALDRAIDGLDLRFRTVLLLIDAVGLSYTQAADLLGLPAGTVMSRLSRAREKVRRRLAAGRGRS